MILYPCRHQRKGKSIYTIQVKLVHSTVILVVVLTQVVVLAVGAAAVGVVVEVEDEVEAEVEDLADVDQTVVVVVGQTLDLDPWMVDHLESLVEDRW